MSTIENEARAEAEAALAFYDTYRVMSSATACVDALRTLLAASRREPSESTAPGASDGTSKSNANDLDREPSDTDEREWEYGYELIESDTRDVLDRGWPYGTAEEARAEGDRRSAEESETSPDLPRVEFYTVRRHHAGPWEVVHDGA